MKERNPAYSYLCRAESDDLSALDIYRNSRIQTSAIRHQKGVKGEDCKATQPSISSTDGVQQPFNQTSRDTEASPQAETDFNKDQALITAE